MSSSAKSLAIALLAFSAAACTAQSVKPDAAATSATTPPSSMPASAAEPAAAPAAASSAANKKTDAEPECD